MTTSRDTRRARVYEAEHLVRRLFDSADRHGTRLVDFHGSAVTLPVERRFASVESVRSYVRAVLALNWVRAAWPTATTPLDVRVRRGAAKAEYEPVPPTLAIPAHSGGAAWALRELVVLHEIAHHLCPGDLHGAAFVDCFVRLVAEIIGPEAGFVLRVAMHENGAVA